MNTDLNDIAEEILYLGKTNKKVSQTDIRRLKEEYNIDYTPIFDKFDNLYEEYINSGAEEDAEDDGVLDPPEIKRMLHTRKIIMLRVVKMIEDDYDVGSNNTDIYKFDKLDKKLPEILKKVHRVIMLGRESTEIKTYLYEQIKSVKSVEELILTAYMLIIV